LSFTACEKVIQRINPLVSNKKGGMPPFLHRLFYFKIMSYVLVFSRK
jgi:hypothetical protein